MKNRYDIVGDTATIYMNYQGGVVECYVDAVDLSMIQITGTWHGHRVGNNIYARGRHNGAMVQMHKLLLPYPLIDHRDKDGLNNRRSNLRESTKSLNAINSRATTDIKGVYWHAKNKNWVARIQLPTGRKQIGVYKCKYEAGRAYVSACMDHYGSEYTPRTPIKIEGIL